MADLAGYQFFMPSDYAALAGTVTADAEWVYVDGALTFSADLYPFDAGEYHGSDTLSPGSGYPGEVAFPFEPPWWFARLPNPLYGARIHYAFDDEAPNAMTDLDPSNVGVEPDADHPQVGKYLFSSVRSLSVHRLTGQQDDQEPYPVGEILHDDFTYEERWELGADIGGAHGIVQPHNFTFWFRGYVLNEYPNKPNWIYVEQESAPQFWDVHNHTIHVVSRGNYTYLALAEGYVFPGMVINFTIQWFNGPGFRCGGDFILVV